MFVLCRTIAVSEIALILSINKDTFTRIGSPKIYLFFEYKLSSLIIHNAYPRNWDVNFCYILQVSAYSTNRSYIVPHLTHEKMVYVHL